MWKKSYTEEAKVYCFSRVYVRVLSESTLRRGRIVINP